MREYARARYWENPQVERDRSKRRQIIYPPGGWREINLKRKYGMSLADFENLRAAQGGLCAICHFKKTLNVDHNHRTGKIRGLLCTGCNTYLGRIKESVESLKRAIAYLTKAGTLS